MIRMLLAALASLVGLILTLPVLLTLLPFFVVSLLTRTIAKFVEPNSVPWQQLIEYDEVVGWRPKANLDVHCLSDQDEGVFRLVTDAQGWQGKFNIADSDIVVFGDSYASGFGVDSGASFIEIEPGLRIKAIGAPGYNMVQELLLMEQTSPQLSGKIVVWFIYYGNDLYDNLTPQMRHYRMPFVKEADTSEGWEIVTSHLSPDKWLTSTGRPGHAESILAAVHSQTYLSDRAFSACKYLIDEGNRICIQAKARLVVFSIPHRSMIAKSGEYVSSLNGKGPQIVDPDLPDREIGEICRQLGVPFVQGKEGLTVKDYKRRDEHWNEDGHRKIGEMMRRIFDSYGPSVPMEVTSDLDYEALSRRA